MERKRHITRTPGQTLAEMVRARAGKGGKKAGKGCEDKRNGKAWFIVEIENTSKWGMMIT